MNTNEQTDDIHRSTEPMEQLYISSQGAASHALYTKLYPQFQHDFILILILIVLFGTEKQK